MWNVEFLYYFCTDFMNKGLVYCLGVGVLVVILFALNLVLGSIRIPVADVILNCGSEMIVAIAGDMLRMPGLPKSPQAERITIENGEIEGLS